MDVLVRDVPEQVVIAGQRMVDQAALESWLPGQWPGCTRLPVLRRPDRCR